MLRHALQDSAIPLQVGACLADIAMLLSIRNAASLMVPARLQQQNVHSRNMTIYAVLTHLRVLPANTILLNLSLGCGRALFKHGWA